MSWDTSDPYGFDPDFGADVVSRAEFEAFLQEQARIAHDAAEEEALGAHVEGLLEQIDARLDDLGVTDPARRDLLFRQALTLDPDSDGSPDVEQAFTALAAVDPHLTRPHSEPPPLDATDDQRQRWLMNQTRALGEYTDQLRTPEFAEPAQPDMDDDGQRQQWMAQQLEAEAG